ncbi:hypothetical protein BD413DRAFT_614630 [Trametes elegans]|nr:hypothetical protein BD413DRAFT_614630 [Trametes elegans]
MASVTDAYTAAALRILTVTVQRSTNASFFAATRDHDMLSAPLGDGGNAKIMKTGVTNTGFVSIGYDVSVSAPSGGGTRYTIWVQNPSVDSVDINRHAVLKGLSDIITNRNVGKSTFNVDAEVHAKALGL